MNKPCHWATNFGLNKNPFGDTIDTDLFFRTSQHEQAAVKIRIGIEDKHALILLAGTSGTGKTLASQVVLRSLDLQIYEPILVFIYPGMGKGALLGNVLQELGITPARFVHDRLLQFQEKALDLFAQGCRLLIIIDEAHFLKADALHLLRTLSNLETEKEKLVTVFMVAEKSILRRLKAPSYASLRGRITFVVHLSPLDVGDLEQYVKYRILKCGGSAALLAPALYPLLHELSRGIPREVNRLLYASFIEAMALGQDVSAAIIKETSEALGAV